MSVTQFAQRLLAHANISHWRQWWQGGRLVAYIRLQCVESVRLDLGGGRVNTVDGIGIILVDSCPS